MSGPRHPVESASTSVSMMRAFKRDTVHQLLTTQMPPQAVDAERAVLGFALIDPGFLPTLLTRLEATDFFLDRHQVLYWALAECRRLGRQADSIVVQEMLRRLGTFESTVHPGLLALLLEDAAQTSTLAHDYLQIIKDAAVNRAAIRLGADLVHRGYEGQSPETLLTTTREGLARLEATIPKGQEPAVVVRLADVLPESVKWIWPGRLALGKLTVLSGDPGLGKSFLSLDVAARLTTGQMWPDGGPAPIGSVVLLTAEDGVADTVRARFDAAGGNPERVYVLRAMRHRDAERPFCLASDLPTLEELVQRSGARVVIIDPVSAYLGRVDSYKDNEVRGLLAPLALMAARLNVAVLLIMHLTKNAQTRALYRTGGSIAFIAAARIALIVAKDPDDDSRRLLMANKHNLSAPPSTLAYRLIGEYPEGPARVDWEPEAVPHAEADAVLMAAGVPEDPNERNDADELLQTFLADGDQPATELLKAAQAKGVTERTLNRAKRRLGIIAVRRGEPGRKGGGTWYCRLPEPGRDPSKTATFPIKSATPADVAALTEQRMETNKTAHSLIKIAIGADMAALIPPDDQKLAASGSGAVQGMSLDPDAPGDAVEFPESGSMRTR